MSLIDARKVEVVSTALQMIASDRYSITRNDDGDAETIAIPADEPSFADLEDYFSDELEALQNMRGASRLDPGESLEEEWSDEWTSRLLDEWGFEPEPREMMLDALRGEPYENVIIRLHDYLTEADKDIQTWLTVGRETFLSAEIKDYILKIDDPYKIDERFKDHLEEYLASFYARRLSRQFPKMVDRAAQLAMMKTDFQPIPRVHRYLEEATKCYVHGQWIACLMVCRSLIEFAVRDRLKVYGFEKELEAFEKSDKGDSLCALIQLGKQYLPWEYGGSLEDAQKVRQVAVRAVHTDPPGADECRELFMRTRIIVGLLYCKSEA